MALKLFLFSLVGVLLFVSCAPAAVPVTQPPAPPTPSVVQIDPNLLSPELITVRDLQFQSFPEVYQAVEPPVYLLDKMSVGEADVIPFPPVEQQPILADQVLQLQVNPTKYDISTFKIERTVTYTTDYTYVAIPIAYEPDYNFSAGVMVGLLEDMNGAYAGYPGSFEVWFFEDSISLYDSNGNVVYSATAGEPGSNFFWQPQDTYIAEPLPFFVKNGCWLCWSLDGRCGCLVCN